MTRRPLLLLAIACLAWAGSPLFAQVAGGLKGLVIDKEGRPIPGATVSVSGPEGRVVAGVATDVRGAFRIVPLVPGRGYRVRVSFPGLATVEMSDVDVAPGSVSNVSFTLVPESAVQERVRVVYRHDAVDPEDTTTQTRFDAEFIDALPLLGRNYQDVLALAPGVSDIDGDGNPNIHGARDTDVVTLVDGVSTVDPLTGRVGQQLDIDSIQEIEVKTSGASAEFGRAQGGFVNIVTKSGGNEFAGDFKMFVRSSVLDGSGHTVDDPRLHGGIPSDPLKFKDLRPFVSVGGPIRKDKAWYFLSGEYVRREDPVNATTQQYVMPTTEKRVFGKVSWDVTTSQKLALTATVDPQDYGNLGIDSHTLVESGYTSHLGGTNLVLKGTSIFSPNSFLESTLQWFESRPRLIPNLDPDTNGNGIVGIDRNHNGIIDPTERDPGEDWDGDGVWDVFEDTNHDGILNDYEDRDGDHRLTLARVGCEGPTREDQDCDGHLDNVNEDKNGNGILDPGEDLDGDNRLDLGTEDRNHNRVLDDRPRPSPDDSFSELLPDGTLIRYPSYYPYDRFRPLPRDRDYTLGLGRQFNNGPYYQDYNGHRGRVTLREDLTVFLPDAGGQHDLKFGGIAEVENYEQMVHSRPWGVEIPRTKTEKAKIAVQVAGDVRNHASALTFGLYAQDTYKPLPNLTLGLGVRFDRETTDSFGYTPFDPAAERAVYDRDIELGPGEPIGSELTLGNGDGIVSQGFCSDPIFQYSGFNCHTNNYQVPLVADLLSLKTIATSRLTQPFLLTTIGTAPFRAFYPEAVTTDPASGAPVIDMDRLRHLSLVQGREPFRLSNNNLAPRLFVSWDPASDSRTKLFLNWSRFYDKLFLDAVVREQGPDWISRYYSADPDGIGASGLPDNGYGALLAADPPSVAQVDRGLRTPYADELTLGFERELAPEVSLKVTYINRRYRDQLQDKDVNHVMRLLPNGEPIDLFGNLDHGYPIADGRPDLYVVNPFFNQVLEIGNFNSARYTGIEVELTKRLSRRWQMEASYTYSRAVGAAEDYLSSLGDDPSVVQHEYGYLDYDQRHVVKANLAVYLPHDWQVGAVASRASGLPYSIVNEFVALDNLQYSQFRTFYGYVDRDKSRFVFLHRNSERNPAVLNINLRAQKSVVIGRLASKLFFSVENLLNSDDLTILRVNSHVDPMTSLPQFDSVRRFGRRFEIGMQVDF